MKDAIYLCVHSGSHGFGEAILREHVERFGAGGLAVGTAEAERYVDRHDHARKLASANRELMAAHILERLRTSGTRLLETCLGVEILEPVDEARFHAGDVRAGIDMAPGTASAVIKISCAYW